MVECKVQIIPPVEAGEVPYQSYTDKEKTLIGVPVVTDNQAGNQDGSQFVGENGNGQSLFNPNDPDEVLELSVYDLNNEYIDTIPDFIDYDVTNDTNTLGSGSVNTLNLDPKKILLGLGIATGTYYLVSRFFKNQLGSKHNERIFYIQEVSQNRQEIRINSTVTPSEELVSQTNEFSASLADDSYFEDFAINFGNNDVFIANNILVDTQTDPENPSVLIHLYEPLPDAYQANDNFYIVTEQADPLNLEVELPSQNQLFDIEPIAPPSLQGPNFNIPIKDQVNNSTDFKSFNDLVQNTTSSLYTELQNILNQKGITINLDYSNFENFVHFSTAFDRFNNFVNKVSSSFGGVTGSLDHLDGYEQYLYYTSNSIAWPKEDTPPPYILKPLEDGDVQAWIANTQISASNYDRFNDNTLTKTIPEYLREDVDNKPYDLFISMMGQHFDNLYFSTKDVTNRFDTDNRINFGLSKDFVAQALRDFGIKIYQNNFSSNDLYEAYLGITATGELIPTRSEKITTYVSASNQVIPLEDVNKETYKRLYHNLPYLLKKKGTIDGLRALLACYGVPDTVLRLSEFGGKDKLNSNDWDYFYRKFTKAINTAGGEDKAYIKTPWLPTVHHKIASDKWIVPDTVQFRFRPNGIPDSPTHYSQSLWVLGTDPHNLDDQHDFELGLFLLYDSGSQYTGSYSGQPIGDDAYYGSLQLVMSGSTEYVSSSTLYLPFFNGDWWSVMIQRNRTLDIDDLDVDTTYKVIAKSTPYEGAEGTTIGHSGSVEIKNNNSATREAINRAWANFSASSQVNEQDVNGFPPTVIQLGASYGSRFGYGGQEKIAGGRSWVDDDVYFSGSIQEIRYYNYPISESIFDDFVMNPESIEGQNLTGSLTSFDILGFRAAAGNELLIENNNVSGGLPPNNYQIYKSIHPSVTASYDSGITGSFIVANPTDDSTANLIYLTIQNSYTVRDDQEIPEDLGDYAQQLEEFYYVDQPIAGIKNRISDKIRLEADSIPGDVLSAMEKLEQNYIASQSYTRDINYFEAAFSPQNEINDDIVASLGYFDIGEYIGDPREISGSSTVYPDLDKLRDEYFQKYFTNYQVKDYVRLIKFFDNSLFKLIKDFTPARTGISSGVVIKQHLLERNKYPQPQVTSSFDYYTGSIDATPIISGSGGGSFTQGYINAPVYGSVQTFVDLLSEIYAGNVPYDTVWTTVNADNDITGLNYWLYAFMAPVERYDWFGPFNTNIISTQIWQESVQGPLGTSAEDREDQREFYNGELPGTVLEVTDGEVGENNPYISTTWNSSNYEIILFNQGELNFTGGEGYSGGSGGSANEGTGGNTGEESGGSGLFRSSNTVDRVNNPSDIPQPGEILMYYVTSSQQNFETTPNTYNNFRS